MEERTREVKCGEKKKGWNGYHDKEVIELEIDFRIRIFLICDFN